MLKNKEYQQKDEIIDDLDETKKTMVMNRNTSSANMWSIR